MAKAKGKRYLEAAKTVGTEKEVKTSLEGLKLVKKAATAKFDETVDVAVKLGVDPRHGDQMIRGVCNLPYGTGKVRKVAVITKDEGIAAAQEAGADTVGGEELVKQIQGGWMDFDILLATPNVMNLVGRLGSILSFLTYVGNGFGVAGLILICFALWKENPAVMKIGILCFVVTLILSILIFVFTLFDGVSGSSIIHFILDIFLCIILWTQSNRLSGGN